MESLIVAVVMVLLCMVVNWFMPSEETGMKIADVFIRIMVKTTFFSMGIFFFIAYALAIKFLFFV